MFSLASHVNKAICNVLQALTNNDEDRYGMGSTNRSRELAVRATYDLMRRRYYERAADPSQNPTWLQRGGQFHEDDQEDSDDEQQ